jgi:hypothetical protein
LDEKRKRLKDQLEARESEAAKEVKQKSYDKKSDEDKLAAEIERVMKEGRKELEAEQERLQDLIQKEKKNKNETSSKSTNFETEASTKLKVRWKSIDKKIQSSDDLYTVESLKSIFSKYGDVSVVIISESSTAAKGSALIEMAARTSAEMASSMETGFEQAPLKVKLLENSVPSVANIHMQANTQNENHAFSSQYTASNFQDHETLVLRKMRQAEERKKTGAKFSELENLEILQKVIDWSKCLNSGLTNRSVAEKISEELKNESQARIDFIKSSLDKNLEDGESAIIFTGNQEISIPEDVEKFIISPPELDLVAQWVKKAQEAMEAQMKEQYEAQAKAQAAASSQKDETSNSSSEKPDSGLWTPN